MHSYPLIGLKHQECVFVGGEFFPDTANAPTYGTMSKRGWTVAYTSTGLFTVTLADVYPGLLSVWAGLRLATGADQIAQIGSISLSSRTIQIRVWDISGAAVADIAANANNAISWGAILTQSTVGTGA